MCQSCCTTLPDCAGQLQLLYTTVRELLLLCRRILQFYMLYRSVQDCVGAAALVKDCARAAAASSAVQTVPELLLLRRTVLEQLLPLCRDCCNYCGCAGLCWTMMDCDGAAAAMQNLLELMLLYSLCSNCCCSAGMCLSCCYLTGDH